MREKNNTRGMPEYEIYVGHKVFQDGKFRVTDLVELSVLERQQEITRQLCEESNRLFDERAALQHKLDAISAKALELCSEAAHVYQKYNVTQMPDRDLVDHQTIQELSDLIRSGTHDTADKAG